MSLRAYAVHRGCSAEAVSKAIKRGRLDKSVVYVDGAPKISNPELADLEWAASTDHSRSSDEERRTTSRLRRIALDAGAAIDPFEVRIWKDGDAPIVLGGDEPDGESFCVDLTPAMARRIGAHLIAAADHCDQRGRRR